MRLLPSACLLLLLLLLCCCCADAADDHCNKKLCASVVSKCQLTQACKCEINRALGECSCCHNCTQCLGSDYTLCCACLGLCEPPSDMSLTRQTQVGDIEAPFHQLFVELTAIPDPRGRWTSYSFPMDAGLDINSVKYDVVPHDAPSGATTANCSVMYMAQCMSVTKCHDNCSKNGAASFRYFYDGCCECVGLTCLNYGINESRCSQCSLSEEENEIDGN